MRERERKDGRLTSVVVQLTNYWVMFPNVLLNYQIIRYIVGFWPNNWKKAMAPPTHDIVKVNNIHNRLRPRKTLRTIYPLWVNIVPVNLGNHKQGRDELNLGIQDDTVTHLNRGFNLKTSCQERCLMSGLMATIPQK